MAPQQVGENVQEQHDRWEEESGGPQDESDDHFERISTVSVGMISLVFLNMLCETTVWLRTPSKLVTTKETTVTRSDNEAHLRSSQGACVFKGLSSKKIEESPGRQRPATAMLILHLG